MPEPPSEDAIRRLAERWNAVEVEPFVELFHPEVVFVSSESWPESGPYVGREAMRTFVSDFRAVWEDVELQIDELFPGADAVAGACHWATRGRASGVEGRLDFSIVLWVRDGLIIRGQFFDELDDALEAAKVA